MTRAEHMAWAKQRAFEYVDRGETLNAISSMLSDLGKHPQTEGFLPWATILLFDLDTRDPGAVRKFIEGFN